MIRGVPPPPPARPPATHAPPPPTNNARPTPPPDANNNTNNNTAARALKQDSSGSQTGRINASNNAAQAAILRAVRGSTSTATATNTVQSAVGLVPYSCVLLVWCRVVRGTARARGLPVVSVSC
jgi:hypothetical protein